VLFCIRLPNFVQIGTSIATAEILRHIVFQDGGRQPCCICFGVMADLKSLIRRINCSVNIAIYRFWPFGLKLPTHSRPFFGEFLGHPPYDVIHHLDPEKTVLGGNTWFEPFSVRICASVLPGCRIEKKGQDNKKVTKVLYFPYFGGRPRWADSTQKLHGGWCPRRNHVCKVSNWNLHALRFYMGLNFRFPYIDFCMGFTTVQQR